MDQSSHQKSLQLLWQLTIIEFSGQYKLAKLGLLWIILSPLLQIWLIGSIMSLFAITPNSYVSIYLGLLLWHFFSTTISKSTDSYINNRDLIRKSKLPKATLPLSIVLANLANLILASFVLIIYLLLKKIVLVSSINVTLLIFALIWTALLATGVSLLSSSLNVKHRDVGFITSSILLLWFYATPIIYPISLIPQSIYPYYALNPLISPLELLRFSLAQGPSAPHSSIIINAFASFVILTIGRTVYQKNQPYFVDWL